VLNDISDIERDRNHPKKKYRPLASGAISKTKALFVMILLLIIAFVLAGLLDLGVLFVIGFYFLLNIAYSFWFKHYVLVDCFIIAIGFMLRLISGSVLFNIQPSSWIILCTFLLSLFLALNKRRSELVSVDQQSGITRTNLMHYSVPLIDNLITTVSSATFISYCIYTLSASKHEYAVLTIIPVLYGIFRYQYLVVMKNYGGSVEETLLKDKTLLFSIAVWIVMNLVMLYLE
jgi:4-hydroxybenzoate polyprenyltransferase